MDTQQPKAEPPARRKPLSVVLRDKGVITIPQDVRDQLELETGDTLLLTARGGVIILEPATLVPRDRPDADADKAAGRFNRHLTDEDFLASLDTPSQPDGPGYGFGPDVALCADDSTTKPRGQFDRVPGDEPELPFIEGVES